MTQKIVIAVGIIIVVAAVALLLTPGPIQAPKTEDSSSATTASSTAVSSSSPKTVVSPTTPKSPPSASVPKTTATKSGSTRITSPVAGTQWVTAEPHAIQWDRESLGNGYISLIDAKTNNVVGIVTPSLVLHQKSFSWNARDIFLNRTSGQKQTIPTGDYRLRLVFEVGRPETVESEAFSVIYANQKTIPSQNLTIQNRLFSLNQVTLKRGERLYITNGDSVDYRLLVSGSAPITVLSGKVHTVDSNSFSSGSYEIYSTEYPNLKTILVVQ